MTTTFGDFTLDVATRRLLHAGAEVHLSPKAFDLLTVLVTNRSQAMTKTDLHARLWPDTFVLESNLAGLIAELRRALGDSAENPRFIRTVPRFGYRFVGDTAPSGAEANGQEPDVRYWLVWHARQVALNRGDNIVGRAPDATVWIDAPGVSRHHAKIRVDAVRATVEDMGSKNGTFVGTERVTTPRVLEDGDRIKLGSIVLTFRIPAPGGSTDSVTT